jgi:SAM-dependent methyltransferase
MTMTEIKQEVKQFYDQVGWRLVSEDVYQNARYEDLRPVSHEYIHHCHLRVGRHLKAEGRYLLDAGSGPVQYPEYLEYSAGYSRRLCADISITALEEARRRLDDHGAYVVADIANLPFPAGVFDGVVSLHTIHHLPEEEHLRAFGELYRVLAPGCAGVVVNGWDHSRLMALADPMVRAANWLRHALSRLGGGGADEDSPEHPRRRDPSTSKKAFKLKTGKGTFTEKHDAAWVKEVVGAQMPVEVRVWRSVSVRFMRALIHPRLGGRYWLRLLYGLEERYPHYFGENGKYPLIIIRKGEEASVV